MLDATFKVGLANTFRRSNLTSDYSNLNNNLAHRHALAVVGSSHLNACNILNLISTLLLGVSLLTDVSLSITVITLVVKRATSHLLYVDLLTLLPCNNRVRRTGTGPVTRRLATLRKLFDDN